MNQYTGFGKTSAQCPPRCTLASSAGISRKSGSDCARSAAKVRVQLVETQIGEIVRVPVAVKVHDHRRVDAHRLQDRFERRRPVGALCDRLNGVGEMPVRAERFVSVKCAKAVAVRVAKHVCKRRFRRGARQQKEHGHALRPSWRRVHPGIELEIFIPELADAQRHAPAERAMPDEA